MDIKSNKFIPTQPKTIDREQDKKLRQAAQDYEQYFIGEMFRAMRQSVPESDITRKGMAEKIYSEQLDQEYIQNWVGAGGVGFADVIYQNIKERYFPDSMTTPLPEGKTQKIDVREFKELPGDKSIQMDLKVEPSDELTLRVPADAELKFKTDLGQGQIAMGFEHTQDKTFSTFVLKGTSLLSAERSQVEEGETFALLNPGETNVIWKVRG